MAKRSKNPVPSNPVDPKIAKLIEFQEGNKDAMEKIDVKAQAEIRKIEGKYEAMKQEYYDKRQDILRTIDEFWTGVILGNIMHLPCLIIPEEIDFLEKHIKEFYVKNFEGGWSMKLELKESAAEFCSPLTLIKEFKEIDGNIECPFKVVKKTELTFKNKTDNIFTKLVQQGTQLKESEEGADSDDDDLIKSILQSFTLDSYDKTIDECLRKIFAYADEFAANEEMCDSSEDAAD